MNKKIELTEIIDFLEDEIISVLGNPKNKKVSNLSNPENVNKYTLDWINQKSHNKQKRAENSKAYSILTDSDILYTDKLKKQGKVIIQVENPKRSIAKVGNTFFKEKLKPGINSAAIVDKDVVFGKNVFIGANVVIGKCIIGDNVKIHANTVLYDSVTIKDNVIINAGAVIGTDGLGCEREKNGTLVRFPHFGGVIIEKDAEIGANCQIAKGALSNTIIGRGTKINDGTWIAHNVVVGKNVWISAQVKIAGSAKICDNVTIFSGAIIREQINVAEGSIIGMGAVVTKDVPSFETWVGNPAKKLVK